MIDAELRSPVVRAVEDLVAAGTAVEQSAILAGQAELFLGWGADGALAVMCALARGDNGLVARLETMRQAFSDVRRNELGASQVEPSLRRYLPFGDPGAPDSPAPGGQTPFGTQTSAIVLTYLTARAWRVRRGIVAAFPAIFSDSDLALAAVARLQDGPDSGQLPGLAEAASHLRRVRAHLDGGEPRGLTGVEPSPSIRTEVQAIFALNEIVELSLLEYQECRSAETRAELLAANPLLTRDEAVEKCQRIAEHYRKRGAAEVAETYSSVVRSLLYARTGQAEEAAALVRDVGYLPADVQVGKLVEAMAVGDVRVARNLARHLLHLVDREITPHAWALANAQLVHHLRMPGGHDPGTSALIGEESIMRCLDALTVLDWGTGDWADLCVTLAAQMTERKRGNKAENLQVATSILAEVTGADIAHEKAAEAHIGLATAYRQLFGDSATENLQRAADHAAEALAAYERIGNRWGASYARLALGQTLVSAAERVRGANRSSLLDGAEAYLSRCDFTPVQGHQASGRAVAAASYLARTVGLDESTAQSLLNAKTTTALPPDVLVPQLLAVCKMLRYSDGTPDLEAHRGAVELHEQVLAEVDRVSDPVAWGTLMFSLANMHTRYPEPTSDMLDRAEEAQRAALEALQAEGADYLAGQVTMALGNLLFRRQHWSEAALWLAQAASSSATGEAWSSTDRGVLAQAAELRETYARLSYAMYRSGRPSRECLERLEQGKTRLAAKGAAPFELGQVAAALPADGALVVPLITSQGSLLWTATGGPDGELTITAARYDDLTSADFEALLDGTDEDPGWTMAYNECLESRNQQTLDTWMATLDQSCRTLWDLIGARIDMVLRAAAVPEGAAVVLAPPPQLSILPVHAAWRPGEDGARHYLSDSYAITYTPGLRILATAARREPRTPGPPSLLTIANPTGDLHGADAEAGAVAAHFPGGRSKILYGDAATRDEITRQAPGRTHFHAACHGSFDSDNPSKSSLYLADGPVRVDDLRTLVPLAQFDLVTLSACETGLLDRTRAPYEWLGIAGALSRSGAANIVCTLWAISDRATVKLMEAFYQSLIADGRPPAQALRAAQAEMKTSIDLRHPYYWAAFMHVGVAYPLNDHST